jgi:hypothetical protein
MKRDRERDWGSYRPYRAVDPNFDAFPGFHPGLFSLLPPGGILVLYLFKRQMEAAPAIENLHAIALG